MTVLGLLGHPDRARPADLVRLPGLERAAACAVCRFDSGAVLPRAAACPLDPDLHGQRGRLSGAVLSAVSAWCAVRQADGGQRLGRRDRELYDTAARPAAGGAGGGARRRARHLWWRQFIRRLLRTGADGAGAVSCGWHPAASDASGDRARHLDLHHVGAARHAVDPERDPDAVLSARRPLRRPASVFWRR